MQRGVSEHVLFRWQDYCDVVNYLPRYSCAARRLERERRNSLGKILQLASLHFHAIVVIDDVVSWLEATMMEVAILC